jgi:hypothetical protein
MGTEAAEVTKWVESCDFCGFVTFYPLKKFRFFLKNLHFSVDKQP